MNDTFYEVVWPLGRSTYEVLAPGAQVADLSGKTVGELWAFNFRGAEIFPLVRKALAEQYSGIKFVDYNVFGDIHGPKEKEVISALPGLLRQHGVDAVITGMAA